MRRFVVGIGFGLAAAGSAAAQTPPPPALPTLGQLAPPAAAMAAAAPAPDTHEWYVRPEAGQWLVMVKGYEGPLARTMAEELAREIRTTHRVPAYLFEKGSVERKKQEAFVAKVRADQLAKQAAFLEQTNKLREQSLAKGFDFEETKPKIYVPKSRIEEQYAVFIGGNPAWKDMDAARLELTRVRAWPPPKNKNLMDTGVVARSGAGGRSGEVAYLNPYQLGMVVPNPAAPRVATDDGLGKVIVKLNENEPLSVLRGTKPWTMVVKSFHPPVRMQDKDGVKPVMLQRLFGGGEGQELQATALQAVSFAKALRDPKFKPAPAESYVLHTLYGSLVCVGQYDSAEDPAMVAMQQRLEGVTYTIRREDQFGNAPHRMFDHMFAMQLPK